MAQAQTMINGVSDVSGRGIYSSLGETIMTLAEETSPLTLRQVAQTVYHDVDTVAAALRDKIKTGELAAFNIGPVVYFASPRTALTMKSPSIPSVVVEIGKQSAWKGKLIFERFAGRIADSIAW